MTVDDDTGMKLLFAKLTPEQGNRNRRALDAEGVKMVKLPEFAGLRRDQLLARALDRLVCGEGPAHGVGPAKVAVLIDYQTLRVATTTRSANTPTARASLPSRLGVTHATPGSSPSCRAGSSRRAASEHLNGS